MTPREIDAKLAEAIGCRVKNGLWEWCSVKERDPIKPCPRSGRTIGQSINPYYSVPTWETAGQLIEGLAAKGWLFEVRLSGECTFKKAVYGRRPHTHLQFGPKAIAEAARIALGIEALE